LLAFVHPTVHQEIGCPFSDRSFVLVPAQSREPIDPAWSAAMNMIPGSVANFRVAAAWDKIGGDGLMG
jgi:hypothetical protein